MPEADDQLQPSAICIRQLDERAGRLVIYHPFPDPNFAGDWRCRFAVGDREGVAAGIDQMQALLLAVQGLGALLRAHRPGATFLGLPSGGLPQLLWTDQ